MTESFLFFCTILFRMNARQNNLQVRITKLYNVYEQYSNMNLTIKANSVYIVLM